MVVFCPLGSQPRHISHLVCHVEVIINGLEVNSIMIIHIHVLGTFFEGELGDDITRRL
jgi:hypothetical protein